MIDEFGYDIDDEEFEISEEYDPENNELDAFLEYLKEKSEGTYLRMIDPELLKEFADACNTITNIVKMESPDAQFTYKLDDSFNTGKPSITIETDVFTIVKGIQDFISSFKFVRSFEALPLTNGNIMVCIGFYSIWKGA